MVYQWELTVLENWTTEEIKNRIWAAVDCRQPTPANVSVEAMRTELRKRGEEPRGYHNT